MLDAPQPPGEESHGRRGFHPIRLRGPWEIRPVTGAPIERPFERVTLPMAWGELVARYPTGCELKRRFNRPTGLAPDQRVWILLPTLPARFAATVNDLPHAVHSNQSGTWLDATLVLAPHNELRLIVVPENTASAVAAELDVVIAIEPASE